MPQKFGTQARVNIEKLCICSALKSYRAAMRTLMEIESIQFLWK